ncbi:hypothetical protein F5890DRAFT_1533577 [Lentinula detonsa]|uniref:Uncharacterized protein n=1 Tax=Lentinula detonsa TaxID=2804962 RepID=A0AA38UPA1_9AGAR|nr:hypothetical protein F5890DRAFT_1533577 [Lentinula detonsa]
MTLNVSISYYVLLGLVALTRFLSMSVSQKKKDWSFLFRGKKLTMVIIHQTIDQWCLSKSSHLTISLAIFKALKCRELDEEDSIYAHFLRRQGTKQPSGTGCPIPSVKYEIRLINRGVTKEP